MSAVALLQTLKKSQPYRYTPLYPRLVIDFLPRIDTNAPVSALTSSLFQVHPEGPYR